MATAQLDATGVGIHNVLIATDFSHQSSVVLNYALNFAHRLGAHAEIAYVLPTDEYAFSGPEALAAAKDAARRDVLELKTRLRCSQESQEDADYRVSMLEGPAADCLLEYAREKRIDLIVVGTHGRGGLGKEVIGSVAEKVFRHSPVPVLTIGRHVQKHREICGGHSILAPCDLTPRSHPAVEFARLLAEGQQSHLTVLHVVEHPNEAMKLDPERVKQGIREELARIVGKYPDEVDVRYRIEFGKIPSAVLSVAAEIDADFIVLGVRPSSGLLDRFMWPIAYELVREAVCPVLTIRGNLPVR